MEQPNLTFGLKVVPQETGAANLRPGCNQCRAVRVLEMTAKAIQSAADLSTKKQHLTPCPEVVSQENTAANLRTFCAQRHALGVLETAIIAIQHADVCEAQIHLTFGAEARVERKRTPHLESASVNDGNWRR